MTMKILMPVATPCPRGSPAWRRCCSPRSSSCRPPPDKGGSERVFRERGSLLPAMVTGVRKVKMGTIVPILKPLDPSGPCSRPPLSTLMPTPPALALRFRSVPPRAQAGVDALPANAVIRGLANLERDYYQRHSERHRGSDRPAWNVERKGRRGEREEGGCPYELERPGHAYDVAEQEEVRDYERDH